MLYHIVFSNIAPDPVGNYVSVDDLYTSTAGAGLQPSAVASEMSVLLKSYDKAPWQLKEQHVPIFCLRYDDGHQQGQGYMDVKASGVMVEDGMAVREVFTVGNYDRSVSSLAVRIVRLSEMGRLKVVVRNGSDEPMKTLSTNLSGPGGLAGWVQFSLEQPLTLIKATRYSVELIPEDGASFRVLPLQQGGQYGFAVYSPFVESHCEARVNIAWTGCMQRKDLDIPFYFR